MLRGTQGQHLFPKLLRLDDLAWSRVSRGGPSPLRHGLFANQGGVVVAKPIGQPVPRLGDEERFQVDFVGDAQTFAAQAVHDMHPHGLDNVGGIKFGPKAIRNAPPHEGAETHLIGFNNLVNGPGITVAEFFEKNIRSLGNHDLSLRVRVRSNEKAIPSRAIPPTATENEAAWGNWNCRRASSKVEVATAAARSQGVSRTKAGRSGKFSPRCSS